MTRPGMRELILAAAVTIQTSWELRYGHALGLGHLAWALPLLTSGYLWLAMDRRSRTDVVLAVAAVTTSALIGATATVTPMPPVALAVWTALLLAVVLLRTHLIDDVDVDQADDVDDPDDDGGPVAVPVTVVRPVAALDTDDPAPTSPTGPTGDPVEDDRATEDTLSDAELAEIHARRHAAGRPMTVDEVHALRGGTRDAARAWHRRATHRVSTR